MNYKVNVFGEEYIIVALNIYNNEPNFILQKLGKKSYLSVPKKNLYESAFVSSYINLRKFEYLLDNIQEKVEEKEFYCINDNYKFKVNCKLRDKWVVKIFDNEMKRIYDFKHQDFEEVKNSEFILKETNKYNKKYKYIQKNISINDIEDICYHTDRLLCEVIEEITKSKLYFDLHGTLRFANEDFNEKEEEFNKDLNNGWCMFYEGKYTIEEVITIYTKMNYSFSGFMEVFHHRLISEEDTDLPEEELKQSIRDIILGKKTCYE